ncbi:nitroreductase family protein [Desulfoluna spongiiphila]|uniref:Nitroreductase n=1 Tax=Desulfoluna spongiiphila TaxID=419481 RepID=A0A1G5JKR1_9BACT|nr:nitroreductase family protein [Desulfoluna spongiiphila]SCY88754.1 Nitroreductase [Desulfoluna spongiiphila]VVS93045.1 nitroreductase [Desulfoluna spongiiphila]
MALFTVDQALCNGDGICAAECPMMIIQMKEGTPTPAKGAEKMCINCGHCVAVCPKGALSLAGLPPENCLSVQKELNASPAQAEQFLRSRRSIRNYKKTPVEKGIIEEAIRVASHAPSGHNFQPVRWQVIYDTDKVKELCGHVIDWMKWMIKEQPDTAKKLHLDLVVAGWDFGMDTINRNAPHLILVNADKRNPTGQAACTIAMSYLELMLPSLGLGGCWNGFFNAAAIFWPPLQKALNLGETTGNYGAMMVGHPKFAYHRMPPRNTPEVAWV